jgi:transposase-like protein
MAPTRRSQKGQKGKAYKIDAVKHYLSSGKSMEAVATDYGVSKTCLFSWKQKYNNLTENGVDDFHDEGGRPPALDEIGMEALKAQYVDRKRKQKLPNRAEMNSMINAQAAATLARRGKGGSLPSLCRPTRQHIHEGLKQKKVEGQRKQHARIVAGKDPRNFFSAIAMTKAFAGQLQSHMVMNFDVRSL